MPTATPHLPCTMSEHPLSADDLSPTAASDLVLRPQRTVALDPACQRRALDTLAEPLAALPDCNGAEAPRASSSQLGGFMVGAGLGARTANIPLDAAQRTTDQVDPPAVSPADPVADSPGTLRIGDPPMGVLAAQGGSPANEHVGDSLAVLG